MSTYVNHRLKIEGHTSILKEILGKYFMGEVLSLKAIIPIPESIQKTFFSSLPVNEMLVGWYLKGYLSGEQFRQILGMPKGDDNESLSHAEEALLEMLEAGNKKLTMRHDMFRKVVQAYLETGYVNWNSWSVVNWGVQNNVYAGSIAGPENERLLAWFRTFRGCPGPALRELSSRYPQCSFELASMCEGYCFSNVMSIQAGAVTHCPSTMESVRAIINEDNSAKRMGD
ncbi:hypothetical protein ACJU26_09620 [Acidithiobacillus sp. M4-SHS-6]|uniref:hypothetical protein n=1 Tax=Acidithiobacillus sp. M4-SHS-6 TaxID=3383024 RepID=UPI0039BDBE7F